MKAKAYRYGVDLKPMHEVDSEPVRAQINHNAWKVCCPDCNGAEYLWIDTPFFMCQSCWNGAVDGRWRRVIVPPNRLAIEAAIRCRPLPENRNWHPSETIEDLRRENQEHGLLGG